MPVSLEGEVATFNPLASNNAQAPLLAISAANNSLRIYDNAIDQPLGFVYIQNLAITSVKVTINDIGQANKWHFILGGGTVADDGGGADVEIDLQKLGVKTIDLFHETNAVRCSVRKFLKSR